MPDIRGVYIYIERWKNDDWDTRDNQDTQNFLEVEKALYKELYPNNRNVFDDIKEDDRD